MARLTLRRTAVGLTLAVALAACCIAATRRALLDSGARGAYRIVRGVLTIAETICLRRSTVGGSLSVRVTLSVSKRMISCPGTSVRRRCDAYTLTSFAKRAV